MFACETANWSMDPCSPGLSSKSHCPSFVLDLDIQSFSSCSCLALVWHIFPVQNYLDPGSVDHCQIPLIHQLSIIDHVTGHVMYPDQLDHDLPVLLLPWDQTWASLNVLEMHYPGCNIDQSVACIDDIQRPLAAKHQNRNAHCKVSCIHSYSDHQEIVHWNTACPGADLPRIVHPCSEHALVGTKDRMRSQPPSGEQPPLSVDDKVWLLQQKVTCTVQHVSWLPSTWNINRNQSGSPGSVYNTWICHTPTCTHINSLESWSACLLLAHYTATWTFIHTLRESIFQTPMYHMQWNLPGLLSSWKYLNLSLDLSTRVILLNKNLILVLSCDF